MTVMIWIQAELSWGTSVDAARARIGPADDVVLLLVTSGAEEIAHGAFAGLLGRGGRDPGDAVSAIEADHAAALLDEAEVRLGRPARRLWRRGRIEREVVEAAADAALLVFAREDRKSVV